MLAQGRTAANMKGGVQAKEIATEQELDARISELQVSRRTRVRGFLKQNYEADRGYVIAVAVLVAAYVIGVPLLPDVWAGRVQATVESAWQVIPFFVLLAAIGRMIRYRTIRPTDDV